MEDTTTLRIRLAEILVEFATRAHEAEEGIPVPPPPDEVNRAVDAVLSAMRQVDLTPEEATEAADCIEDYGGRTPLGLAAAAKLRSFGAT